MTKIQTNPLWLPWLMWGAGALFYFYEFLLQVSPNVMVPHLMADFGITANMVGLLTSAYFYAYALMQIPAGMLLDRLGPKRLLAGASITLAVGCLLFASAQSFTLAVTARFFIGLGSAFAVVGCMKLAANWFPQDRFALMIGLTVAIGMMGAIMGEAPLAWMISAMPWRTSMFYLSVVGVGLSIMFLWVVRDHPVKPAPSNGIQTWSDLTGDLLTVIKSSQIWWTSIYGCLMFAPTITFCGLWGGPFLVEKCQISTQLSAAMVSLVFIGWIVGGPMTGWLSDQIGRRLPTMIIGALGAGLCMTLVIYVIESMWVMSVLMVLFGLCSSGFLTAFSIVREISPTHISASALGFMNMMNTLGIALVQPLVGVWLDLIWSGKTMGGISVYTLSEYQQAMLPIAVAPILAMILTYKIRETYCQVSTP